LPTPQKLKDLEVSCRENFTSIFETPPILSASAPGRVNLIGEHVDYQDGLVAPLAIDRHVVASAAPLKEKKALIWSSTSNQPPVVVDLNRNHPLKAPYAWANYIFGVIACYRAAGHDTGGLAIAIDSNLPSGAGLSSSAALESATALIVEEFSGNQLPARERAQLCRKAEHQYAGVPCGIMDQMAVNCGMKDHALEIDCRTLEITPFTLPAELSMVVVDTKVKHSLADGEYAKRKDDCVKAAEILGTQMLRDTDTEQLKQKQNQLGSRLYRRAHHVVSEITRVKNFTAAMKSGNPELAGSLMNASHASLRDDFEVSCPELNTLVEMAEKLEAIGSRMMGGGFGGSTINLVHSAKANEFTDQLVKKCREEHGWTPEAFVVSAVDAAELSEPS